MPTKVILVDDHKIVRDGLRSLLEKQSDMEVIAEAENGRQAVQLAKKLAPQVVIMDVALPDLNGIEAAAQIKAEVPAVKILFLSMHSDRRFVTRALQAGASGYLIKDCAWDELVGAIRSVMAHRTYLSPAVTGVIVEEYLQQTTAKQLPEHSLLTAREREVLQLIAEGKTTKEIAAHLHVSVKTVETYRRLIMEKLNIHSVAELTKYAVREGLTSLEK